MAERRMFAKTIVLSDTFLDMPLSARCLYFTLGMLADDDGFINNPKSIMRQCGASEDDMKLLIAKSYLLTFDTGVIVIKHWRINNYLRGDRHIPTQCRDELAELRIDNDAYVPSMSQNNISGIPGTATRSGIPRIGKDRLGKDRLGKDREDTSDDGSAVHSCPFMKIKDLYHQLCPSFPKIRDIDGTRKGAVAARWRTWQSLETFEELFKKAEASEFLKGNNDRNWHADFDWMIKATNAVKILENRYGEFTKRGENDDNYIKRGGGIGGESDRTTGFVPSTGFRRGNEEIPDAGTGEGA